MSAAGLKPQRPRGAEGTSVAAARSHPGSMPPKNPARPVQKITTAFRLFAPSGKSVKLAADFTDWEQHALSLARDQNGVWEIKVPLQPGNYAYRFLVDGQWQDDPQCKKREPNPFGSTNAIAHVG